MSVPEADTPDVSQLIPAYLAELETIIQRREQIREAELCDPLFSSIARLVPEGPFSKK